jgi:hypothetical protein
LSIEFLDKKIQILNSRDFEWQLVLNAESMGYSVNVFDYREEGEENCCQVTEYAGHNHEQR